MDKFNSNKTKKACKQTKASNGNKLNWMIWYKGKRDWNENSERL